MDDNKPTMSDEELFMRLMANFADFGDWKIRKAPSRGSVTQVYYARLKGENGVAEVWGSRGHRPEVWYIDKDKNEKLVAYDDPSGKRLKVSDGTFRLAVATACNLAGVQPALFPKEDG